MSKKFLSVFLALVMAFALFPITGAAEGDVPEFSDMPVGGAGEALQFAVDNGLLNGYDGKIMPYDPLTRAQMAAIMARAFGATEKADVSGYTDLVGVDEWIVDSMAKALKMGIMQGYDNKMDPNGYITREQAFVVLARVLKLEPSATSRKWYSDADELSEWAKGYVFTLVNAGYITGTGDTLNPKDYITRADFAQLMYNTVKQFINVPGEYTKVADGNVVVNVPDVTLKNVTINGDLIVGDGVGEGDLTLDNVVVKGRMLVRGGGIESIVIVGGGVEGKVIVAKADGNVRVVVDGADVEVVVIDDGKNEVVIEGTVGAVDINASDVPVAIRGGKVGEVKVSCEGSAVITVADDAEVGSIAVADSAEGTSIFVKGSVAEIETSAANTMVYGSGEVGTVSVGSTADNTSVTTPNTVINNGGASGVTAAGGKEVPVVGSVQNNATGTNIVTSPAPSDGDETGTTPTPTPTPQPQPIPQVPAGPVVVPVYGVRIEGTPKFGQVLTAVVNPSSATVKYQWLRSDNDGVNFEEIEGATGRTYTLTEKDVGKYIKVKVTGVQFYFGTAESTSFGPVTAGEEPEPVVSTYKFSYEVPADVVAGKEVVVPVTFKTDVKGDIGYEGVRFKFTAQGSGDVTFKAKDSNNDEYTFTNEGYWGPPGGFDLPAAYSATTEWTLVFSEAGDYTITFSLIDADTEEVIAGITASADVTVKDPVQEALDRLVAELDMVVTDVENGFNARFDKDYIEVPAVLSGYKIDVLVELKEELPADARVTILYNGKPTAADKVAVAGTEIWLSDLVLGGEPADFVSGDVATWTVLISGNDDDVTVKGTIKSIVSSDGFVEEKVVLAEADFEFEAKDSVAPELVSVDPEKATVELAHDETFVWTVQASDENLYELEVDHNIADLPEFSVYASEEDPYGGQGSAFAAAGVTVDYDAAEQKWTIDFGKAVTDKIVAKGGITFYLVIKDEAGNQWGSMYDVTDENTFVYHISQPDTLHLQIQL